MGDEDECYEEDFDDDFDNIEYRAPAKPVQAPGTDGTAHGINGQSQVSSKRGRDDAQHHVDVAPGDGASYIQDEGNNQFQGQPLYPETSTSNGPASKRSAGGAPGSQHAVTAPYSNGNFDGAIAGTGPNAYAPVEYGQGPVADPGAGAGVPDATPMCACSVPSARRVSNTAKNPNRGFFKCAKPQGQGCDFFKWEDELNGGPAAGGGYGSAPKGAGYSQSAGGGYGAYGGGGSSYAGAASSGAYGGGGGAYGSDNPYGNPNANVGGLAGAQNVPGGGVDPGPGGEETAKCQCGIDCPVKTSNSANNPGRQFWACPKMRDDPTRCRFFQWTDEPPGGIRAGGGGGGMEGAGFGGGGASAVVCYSCNQPGHFASNCPQKAAGGGGGAGGYYGGGAGGGGGGGAASGNPCYQCGETGHWARDCPMKGNGGGRGGGGYGGGGGRGGYGGGGGGPPQSFASRFNRDGGSGGGGFGGGGGSFGGGGGYGGGGGGGGGKGNCYKCGMPGHWSSSCPNAK